MQVMLEIFVMENRMAITDIFILVMTTSHAPNEIAYKMRCPAGLMYNVEKDQCDYPGNVVCILERTCKY